MRKPGSISVVLPTYNCRSLLVRHLHSMQAWLDVVHEVIVVDSRSTDGTLEAIRQELRHPNLRIIERDRGLYQSWNEGIAATTGDWVYISTAGDTITREHLLHLRDLGERLAADVVVSPPYFVHEDGRPRVLLESFGQGAPLAIQPEATQILAFQFCPQAILGSSAADLYRGNHLRARPFPTEYGVVGDTAWIMRYGHETRLALTPTQGSAFCIHEKESSATPQQSYELYLRLLGGERDRLRQKSSGPQTLLEKHFARLELPARTQELRTQKRLLWRSNEKRLLNRLRWVVTTLRYFWYRAKMKRQGRQGIPELRYREDLFIHLPK
jgi:glycosyltransferase involved in cell wall biosynthesis